MVVIDVDNIEFSFDETWVVSKYDEWQYYLSKFQKMHSSSPRDRPGVKAVDLVAVQGDLLMLIEVKDYRHPETAAVPIGELPDTMVAKCRDTLAGLLAASLAASEPTESALGRQASQASRVGIVLHCELVRKTGRLHNPDQVLLNLTSDLRRKLKLLDPHARVEMSSATHGQWVTKPLPV